MTAAPEHQPPPEDYLGERHVYLTPASTIRVRPVRWLMDRRVALGTFALLGGREGIGKSTLAYTFAADITCGRLPGVYQRQPRSVIVAATEDSWEHTIVPRLMAAGADLKLVYRVDVTSAEGVETGLSLPRDLGQLERSCKDVGAALILLDPLMSRLAPTLDSHKDAEVRQALEPLVALAQRADVSVLGLIHVSKSHSTDPLTTLMASRAFAAVARAVLFVIVDPDDETEQTRLLGQPKNNLGSTNTPTLAFRIESHHVASTPEGDVVTGRVRWLGEVDRSIRDALESTSDTADSRTATSEAANWLRDHLASQGGTDESASIKAAGAKVGHSISTLRRARMKIKASSEACGFPRRTYWTLAGTAVSPSSPGESEPTEPIELTELTVSNTEPVGSVDSVGSVGASPRAHERTAS